jgi:heme-degrading monooxygenase HmoA
VQALAADSAHWINKIAAPRDRKHLFFKDFRSSTEREHGRLPDMNNSRELDSSKSDRCQARMRPCFATMICRIWHGRTLRHKADAYASFLEQRAIPDYRSVAGNLSVQVLRRDAGEATHFLTVTLWESEQAIRGFAGDELLVAKYYPEDAEYLLEFEREVQHFVVSAHAPVDVRNG